MKVIRDGLLLCGECLQAAVNGDYSCLDYYYDEAEADSRMAEIQKGLDRLGTGLTMGDNDFEFCKTPCDCCGTRLHGYRHEFCVLC